MIMILVMMMMATMMMIAIVVKAVITHHKAWSDNADSHLSTRYKPTIFVASPIR